MTPERWSRVKEIFSAAMEEPPDRRETFLNEACPDESLRAEVRRLVQAEDSPTLESPLSRIVTPRGSVPAVIGRYRIVRLLGEGGMGAVYEAEQDQPRRRVALKAIRPGLVSPALLRRFEHETQALGLLQHPGIAQIYEAGAADWGFGLQPYFAMEFVHGTTLLRYAEEHRIAVRQRLELMAKVCDAVHHAHQRGIIHRDLKPGNILVDDTGQPKIVDFGVARITDADGAASRHTDVGQVLGTLAYMSPEQVLADPSELDIRSDVYALGVILYELLAGRLPYQIGDQLTKAAQTICEVDPARLSSINRTYRGDVETIVAKALEKDKARRYSSAVELAADIQRYLKDEPIVARRASAVYHLRKFARRHRALVASVAAALVMLIAGVIASTWEAARAWRAEQDALRQRDSATAARQSAQAERDRAVGAELIAEAERKRAIAEKQHADTESATATAINDFLQKDLLGQASAYAQARSGGKPDPDLKVRTALDRAAARIEGRFERQPLVEAAIRQTIGRAYMDLGIFPAAERQLARALDLRRRTLGEQHRDTLVTSFHLGAVYRDEGRYADAEPLLTKVAEIWRLTYGPRHPETLNARDALATLYRSKGEYAKAESLLTEGHRDTYASTYLLANLYTKTGKNALAEPLYLKLLESQRRELGEEHPKTLMTMHKLADLYRQQGKYTKSEPLLIKVLEMRQRTLGPEHYFTGDTMNSLALLYEAEGKYTRAEPLLRQAVEICRRQNGEENTDTLTGMGNLARLYRRQGRYALAESLLLQVLERQRRLIGEENPNTLLNMDSLAGVYRLEGGYGDAETLMVKVLGARRRILGEEHPDTLSTSDNLANIYRLEGRYTEAEPLIDKVLEARRRTLGPEHPDTLLSMNSVASLYMSRSEYDKAEPALQQLVDIRRRVSGEDHPETLSPRLDLADLYRREGKYTLAEPLFLQVLAAVAGVLGEEHPVAFAAESGLSNLYRLEGRYAEAELLNVKAVDAQRRVLGPEHRSTLMSMTSLGILYQEEGKLSEAEPLLTTVLPLDRRVLGATVSTTKSCMTSLARLRLAQHRYADAEALLRESLTGRDDEGPYSWQPSERRSLLGLSLMEQSKFAEAEPLLIAGYQGLVQRKSVLPATVSLEEAAERIVRLHSAWGGPP